MEKAILKAIDGGYVVDIGWKEKTRQGYCERNRMQLDPLFWQCLGKACRWPFFRCQCGHFYDMEGTIKCPECNHYGAREAWDTTWHKFIDWLGSGKSPDSFFTALLTNQE